jgi:hypothetical protein
VPPDCTIKEYTEGGKNKDYNSHTGKITTNKKEEIISIDLIDTLICFLFFLDVMENHSKIAPAIHYSKRENNNLSTGHGFQ